MQQKVETRHEVPPKYEVKLESKNGWLTPAIESKSVSVWMPVNPARTSSGAWASLAKVLGEDKARPIPLDPSTPLSSFSIVATEVDLSLAAKLGLGNIFSGTLNYGDRAFYMDATAFAEEYKETPGNPVVGTRWGVGLRVLLHVSDIKAGLSLNFGIVGAAVQLGYAKALYEIDGMGLQDGLSVVLGELHGFGDFSAETFFRINDSVIPKLADYMQKNPSKLIPVPYQVQLIEPVDIDSILGAKSIIFAMRRLRDGCALNEALAKSAGRYNEQEIGLVYAKLTPGSGPNDHPPENARDNASDWLKDN